MILLAVLVSVWSFWMGVVLGRGQGRPQALELLQDYARDLKTSHIEDEKRESACICILIPGATLGGEQCPAHPKKGRVSA